MAEQTMLSTNEYIERIMAQEQLNTNAPKQVGGNHYNRKIIQPWDYIYANNLCYFTGNCVKYVSRWKDKGGVDDLKKARHYLDKLIELEEGKE